MAIGTSSGSRRCDPMRPACRTERRGSRSHAIYVGSMAGSASRVVYQAVKTGDKRLEVLSGPFDGRHGWQLLNNPADRQFTSAATDVAAFRTALGLIQSPPRLP
jgi:hypothetical protein